MNPDAYISSIRLWLVARTSKENVCLECKHHNRSCSFGEDTFAIACYWFSRDSASKEEKPLPDMYMNPATVDSCDLDSAP